MLPIRFGFSPAPRPFTNAKGSIPLLSLRWSSPFAAAYLRGPNRGIQVRRVPRNPLMVAKAPLVATTSTTAKATPAS
jgi:hypothetical protein